MSLQKTTKYEITDKADEAQIINLEDFGKAESLVYMVNDEPHLSFGAIKEICYIMAKSGEPLETIDSQLELLGEDEEKAWYACVTVKSSRTGQREVGVSEASFYDKNGKKDKFARAIAHSKAERNAKRKLIPEKTFTENIKRLLNSGKVKNLK